MHFNINMKLVNCIMLFYVLMTLIAVEGNIDNPNTNELEGKPDLGVQGLHMEREYNMDHTPVKLRRRSLRHMNTRSRRKVKTILEALKINEEKLVNLTIGVQFLIQSMMMPVQTRYVDIIQRLEHMSPFFISTFVMLADIAFSTSSRISNRRDIMFELSDNFEKPWQCRQIEMHSTRK